MRAMGWVLWFRNKYIWLSLICDLIKLAWLFYFSVNISVQFCFPYPVED